MRRLILYSAILILGVACSKDSGPTAPLMPSGETWGQVININGFKTAASGKRLHIYDTEANAVLSAFDTEGAETVILYPDIGTPGTPRLKLTDGIIYCQMGKDGIYTLDGSAIAALQISGTGHGELILYDDAGNLNAKIDSETGYADVASDYRIGGIVVLDGQGSKVNDPAGGATVDTECRAQLAALINELERIKILASQN